MQQTKWIHSSTPGIFCWDMQPLETTNINNKDQKYQLGTFFKVIAPFNWTSFQNMQKKHVELANKAQAHNRGSRLVLLGS